MQACMFAGLARTLFMEQRALFGPTIDLQVGAGLPSAAQLAHMACSSGEFAVAFRNGRAFGLRMVPSARAVPRSVALIGEQSSVVSGGTKVCPSGTSEPHFLSQVIHEGGIFKQCLLPGLLHHQMLRGGPDMTQHSEGGDSEVCTTGSGHANFRNCERQMGVAAKVMACFLGRAWALSTLASSWQGAAAAWCSPPGLARFLWKCCRSLHLPASPYSPLALTRAMPTTLQPFCNGSMSTCLPCSTMHMLRECQALPCLTAWAMLTSGRSQSRRWGRVIL